MTLVLPKILSELGHALNKLEDVADDIVLDYVDVEGCCGVLL